MIKRIKGMYDLLPPQSHLWRRIEATFFDVAGRYGFETAATPIVERSELFARSIGEATDIIEKEMYTFPDRRGRALSLRPEGTASMVRAYIENKVANVDPVAKWVYGGPMYRYERPQKGRNRQFFQLGAEVFGVPDARQDAELIAMAMAFFEALEVEGLSLELNSLGDPDERRSYRDKLVNYLTVHKDALCADCLRRLDTNPMRVLDCKIDACRAIAQDAPLMLDHLGDETRRHFDDVCSTLTDLGVAFTVNRRIVRGLDYYNRTAFEIKASALGAQDAVGGGGRYDSLIKELGGPPTPAVGFALGVERLVLLLENQVVATPQLDFYFIPMGEAAQAEAVKQAALLRAAGACGEVDFSGRRLKHLFARAESRRARTALILGENELAKRQVVVRNLTTKEQHEILLDDLCLETLE